MFRATGEVLQPKLSGLSTPTVGKSSDVTFQLHERDVMTTNVKKKLKKLLKKNKKKKNINEKASVSFPFEQILASED